MKNFNRYEIPNPNKDINQEYITKLSNEDTYTRNYIDRPLLSQGNEFDYPANNQANNTTTNNFKNKETEYEKLLHNLNLSSGSTNNFFYILQGILGINCDTLFTDFSITNVKEKDKRLQMILETLMDKLKM